MTHPGVRRGALVSGPLSKPLKEILTPLQLLKKVLLLRNPLLLPLLEGAESAELVRCFKMRKDDFCGLNQIF